MQLWSAISAWLFKKKKKERVQNQAKPCVFQEETMQDYIKRQNWLLENQELFLMRWPRKINCKVLWGFLKIYKKNWWAVLVKSWCSFFSVLNDNKYSLTQYNFILTARETPVRCLRYDKIAGQKESWHSFLQGLINRGIGIKSRRAGLHKFGRVMWGNRTQGAGGCSVCYAGHYCHNFCYLLF